MANPKFDVSDRVDILFGGDIYTSVILEGVKRNILGNLMSQVFIFGCVLTGLLTASCSQTHSNLVSYCTELKLDERLERFLEIGGASKAFEEDA